MPVVPQVILIPSIHLAFLYYVHNEKNYPLGRVCFGRFFRSRAIASGLSAWHPAG
jgi:hypothetical protein